MWWIVVLAYNGFGTLYEGARVVKADTAQQAVDGTRVGLLVECRQAGVPYHDEDSLHVPDVFGPFEEKPEEAANYQGVFD